MAAQGAETDPLRGARLHERDLTGLEIRDCEVSGLTIVGCFGTDVHVDGLFDRVVVNDVDVTAFVEAELDRRHPARVLVRGAVTPDDLRAAWQAVTTQWESTIDRARLLPEDVLHEQVRGEWSFVQTQRHLLFASDAWLGNAVLEEPAPYHPWGLPADGMPEDTIAQMGLDLDATPALDDVLTARRERMATTQAVLDDLTEAELARICGRRPTAAHPDREIDVRRCLQVLLREEVEHHRFALRDLAVLEARRGGQPAG